LSWPWLSESVEFHKVFSEEKLKCLLEQQNHYERARELWSSARTVQTSKNKSLTDFAKL